ncbi:putative serine/threonine kinase and phosphatase [Cellvibrio sp. BR]|jgi:serine/threonine protein phosphatase PrpC/predicted Ser/Thr protein kinase|uniref:bifunctional protein-serine/threonine kinase/phosphatase n=1 Tax=Cellvibrio sp. BR TaxID=1134474 RepID=UPI0002601715|nr:bifunctional protein-serine/threonine kinase/phosphatase [Cellvibrio sp. BR]EIK46839.1 putative serine/threonine kinase and phosphatase [Cellvibrio sp. BR]
MDQWHLGSKLAFTLGQASTAGIKAQNEDAIGMRIPEGMLLDTKGAVAIIADGVSAAEAGKEASETCVRNFLADYFSTPDTWTVKKSTTQVLVALNRWLFSRGQHFRDAQKGFVSTLSCIIFKSHSAHIFHVGDSRIYRFRAGVLEQLTRDHRTVINAEQSYLVRAMGLDVSLDVDCKTIDLEEKDIFLLSTDGLHDFVSDEQLSHFLQAGGDDYELLSQQLLALAAANQSDDNISCQLLRIDSLPAQNINDACQKLGALPFPPHLTSGMEIDGYRVEKELHASSRSQVYLVRDLESNQLLCMKTPSINFCDDPAYIERFILEAWIGSRIHNAHVVKVIAPNKPKSCLYYLMEYIDGETLNHWIKKNPLPSVQTVIYMVEQICKGLRAFHRRETLHQDLRPANIMVDRHGEIKIIDFGSCLVKGIAEISSPIARENILGTAEYSAPETILAGKSDEKSDVFSLAVIVFEMLTGSAPFDGKLANCRTERAYLNTRYTSTYELNPLVPFWVDGAIRKGLRYDLERRHADVSEFLHELQHPNPKYKQHYRALLLEKNPLRFWQGLSAILFVALCVSFYF